MSAVAAAIDEAASTPATASVALSADDPVVRDGIEASLADAQFDTLPATSMNGLHDLCGQAGVAVAVIGCQRDRLRRPWQVEAMRRAFPDLLLLVVSDGDSRNVVRDAMAAGADGYVAEDLIEARLPIAVEAVLAGHICVPRSMRRQVMRVAFTRRERQVLALVRRGFSNREIADAMYLSESTVKSHLSSAFRKLGVTSRTEAAALLSDPNELERIVGASVRQLVTGPEARAGAVLQPLGGLH